MSSVIHVVIVQGLQEWRPSNGRPELRTAV